MQKQKINTGNAQHPGKETETNNLSPKMALERKFALVMGKRVTSKFLQV